MHRGNEGVKGWKYVRKGQKEGRKEGRKEPAGVWQYLRVYHHCPEKTEHELFILWLYVRPYPPSSTQLQNDALKIHTGQTVEATQEN